MSRTQLLPLSPLPRRCAVVVAVVVVVAAQCWCGLVRSVDGFSSTRIHHHHQYRHSAATRTLWSSSSQSTGSHSSTCTKSFTVSKATTIRFLALNDLEDETSATIQKETTWDRITGPKLFKTVTQWQGIHAVPLVPLRIATGLLMMHHGSEGGVLPANVGTPEFQGFVDYIVVPYFGFLPGPPELWSAIHDYVEYCGGVLLAVGFLTRPAALALFATMVGAVYFHLASTGWQGFPLGHVPNYSYDFEEPTLYAFIFLLFWFNGAVRSICRSFVRGTISDCVMFG
jgi:putative oxidoreductase